MLVAFAMPLRAEIILPKTQVLLTWTSLGLGTTYYVQTSTNLTTWTTQTSTTATNVNLSLDKNTLYAFRLAASNAPPQTVTLGWNSCQPVNLVAGYYVYYGNSTGNYTDRIDAGLATTSVMSNLLAGAAYYFAVAGYTSSGSESALSTEIVWKCPLFLQIHQLP